MKPKKQTGGKGTSLVKLQTIMASVVMNPLNDNYETAKKLRSGEPIEAVAKQISKPNAKLSSLDRISIYNRQYWYRLIDSLFEDFPGVLAVLGHGSFEKLIRGYLEVYPSQSFTMRNLGKRLPGYIKASRSLSKDRRMAAYEMALFEWAQIEAFDSAAYPVVTPTDFAAAGGKLVFTIQPYIQLLAVHYPFDDLFLALRKRQAHASAEASVVDVSDVGNTKPMRLPKKKDIYLVVHRYQNSLYYKRLDKPSFTMLAGIRNGLGLENAFNKILPLLPKKLLHSGQAPALIRKWFINWSTLGWLCTPTGPPKKIAITKNSTLKKRDLKKK